MFLKPSRLLFLLVGSQLFLERRVLFLKRSNLFLGGRVSVGSLTLLLLRRRRLGLRRIVSRGHRRHVGTDLRRAQTTLCIFQPLLHWVLLLAENTVSTESACLRLIVGVRLHLVGLQRFSADHAHTTVLLPNWAQARAANSLLARLVVNANFRALRVRLVYRLRRGL